jgi:hypothetical protein
MGIYNARRVTSLLNCLVNPINAIVVSVAVLLCGCSVQTVDEVIGRYKLRYSYGTEELQLDKDGTYIQSIFIDGETTAKVNKGRWEFHKKESEVVLIDAMIVDDFFGRLKPEYWKIEPGLSIFHISKAFGKVSISVNRDQGYSFEKIRNDKKQTK